jgi:hypothetical protein
MRKLKCRSCKRRKNEDQFHPRADTKRGRRSECIPCGRDLNQVYYRQNRRRVIARVTRNHQPR